MSLRDTVTRLSLSRAFSSPDDKSRLRRDPQLTWKQTAVWTVTITGRRASECCGHTWVTGGVSKRNSATAQRQQESIAKLISHVESGQSVIVKQKESGSDGEEQKYS